jgi:FAD reductase [NAD(P)H]
MKVLGISGTITGSKTLVVVEKVLESIKTNYPEIEIEILDLKKFDVRFCDGRDPSTYTGDTKKVIDIVAAADFYIIGTPIFQGSITGALKNLIDLMPVSDLRGKVMGFIATAGTTHHYLVIENQLKPIAGYFRAFVAPSHIYAENQHFNKNNEIIDQDVLERVDRLAHEVVLLQKALSK